MKITINNNITIGDIKKEFQNRFPFLRLDFFSGVNNEKPNPLHRILDESKKIEDLRTVYLENEMNFSGEEKVLSVENRFREKFGLNVQVFRKSGTQWLLTTSTDDLTLNQQNELGKEMSVRVASPEPEDIHEQP